MRGRDRPAASLPDAARAIARGLSAGLPLADAFARGSEAVDACTAAVLRDCAAALDAGDATTTAFFFRPSSPFLCAAYMARYSPSILVLFEPDGACSSRGPSLHAPAASRSEMARAWWTRIGAATSAAAAAAKALGGASVR